MHSPMVNNFRSTRKMSLLGRHFPSLRQAHSQIMHHHSDITQDDGFQVQGPYCTYVYVYIYIYMHIYENIYIYAS